MGDAWVSVGLERHLRGSGASPWRSMCISLSFCAPQPSFWPFLPHSTHYWELPKKTGGQVAEISLHHLFCKWLSRALGEVLRLCFGMKSPNMEHTAPYGQPASSIMLMPRFSQQPFLTKDTQGMLLPKWAPPRHAGRQLQHEFGSEKCAISSSAQPEKCCIVGCDFGHGSEDVFQQQE